MASEVPETGAWLYDGRSAMRHAVEVTTDGGRLRLTLADGGAETVEPSELFHATDRDGAQVYGRKDSAGWRLGLPPPVPAEVAALLPGVHRYGRWIDRVGLAPALAVLLAVSAGVLAAGHFLPGQLAPLVPTSWEKSYGDAIVGDFGGKYCRGPGGQDALEKLARRLSPEGVAFDVRVVDIGIVNAAALPGNHIVLFRELLTDAKGPDEVAGVLAHEIAHVGNRHVTEGMIRELGFGMVVTALGGTTAGNADMLLGSRYSRAAETEADRDAIAMLAAADVSPIPTAKFFGKIGRGEKSLGRVGETLSYVSTHPLSEGRRAAFQRSFVQGRRYTPALAPAEWRAVRDICRNDPENVAEREERVKRKAK